MASDNQSALNELKTAFEQANTASISIKIFSASLCDFVEKYERNPILRAIDASVVAMRDKDYAPLLALRENGLQEVKFARDVIKDYAIANNITLLQEWFKRLESMVFLTPELEGLNLELMHMLSSLLEDTSIEGRYDFVCRFGTIECPWPSKTDEEGKVFDNQGRLASCTFAPSFYRWDEERQLFEHRQKKMVWFSREKLVTFYQDIEHGTQRNLSAAEVEECRYHLQKYYNYTHSTLSIAEDNSEGQLSGACVQKEASLKGWHFDGASLILHLNGKKVQFRAGSLRAYILKRMCRDGKSKKKEWSWDELDEEINEGIVEQESVAKIKKNFDRKRSGLKGQDRENTSWDEPDDENVEPESASATQMKFYEAFRGLVARSRESGIPDFLIVKDKTIKINDKYL